MSDTSNAVYNPNEKPLDELPVIYGFNNGPSLGPNALWGVLLAEDGTHLGDHICSNEGFMYHDLGILENSRPDRHETFRAHYPDGYRMEFVGERNIRSHDGLDKAVERNHAIGLESR